MDAMSLVDASIKVSVRLVGRLVVPMAAFDELMANGNEC